MKELLKRLEEAEKRSDEIEALWDEDPENEDLEREWDETYKVEHKAFEDLKEAIIEASGNIIEPETARVMILKYRDQIKELINKAA